MGENLTAGSACPDVLCAGRSLNIRPLFEMLEGGKTSKLMMTKLQDEEAEAAPSTKR